MRENRIKTVMDVAGMIGSLIEKDKMDRDEKRENEKLFWKLTQDIHVLLSLKRREAAMLLSEQRKVLLNENQKSEVL